jgi:flavin reductase (DIM6/NTAB) family NADH-FMN oxidoreductase RutF
MYYEPGTTDHGLPFDPFKSCVVPRPIGWISTVGADGADNLAPYSQFQNVGFDPPIVMFSANQNSTGGRKNSVVNAEARGEFVWNMATYALREAVNITSEELPLGVDEFERAGLAKIASKLVAPKRVKDSPVHFECKYLQTTRLPGNGAMGSVDVVFGRVVAIHIDDAAIRDGKVDIACLRPLARLGYYDYTFVETVFSMAPPGKNAGIAAGLEGSPIKAAAALKR